MVSTTTSQQDFEPTTEFNDSIAQVLHNWNTGELPFKEALALVSARSQEAIASNHFANQGRAEHALGYLQHYRGDLNASTRHYERARQLFQRIGNNRRMATMDMNNGENYRLKGDFLRARRLYRDAFDAAVELENIPLQAMSSVNEGLVLMAMVQMSEALTVLERAHNIIEQWTDEASENTRKRLLCELYHGLTSIYLYENRLDEAWDAACKAMDYVKQAPEKIQLGMAYRNLGEVVGRLESVPESDYPSDPDEYFRIALDIFREMNMEAEIAKTIFAQAQNLAHRGRKTMAARKLQQVMIMFTEMGMVDDAARAAGG
jgi:tetratricopeptide (TPR) repeat protein